MRPLLITATTPHGLALSRPWGIALDGLLASVLWHRHKLAAREAGSYVSYRPEHEPVALELPLARCGNPDRDHDWHWMATFADLHPHELGTIDPDIRWRTSRTNHTRLQQLAPHIGSQSVSDSQGRYQRRVIPVHAHPARTATWRAVGDGHAIGDLLTDLPSIGKHRGVGEGVVTRWEVAELDPHETTVWSAGHEHSPGVLGRTAPPRCLAQCPSAVTGPPIMSAIRPPYLHPGSRTTAYQPAR